MNAISFHKLSLKKESDEQQQENEEKRAMEAKISEDSNLLSESLNVNLLNNCILIQLRIHLLICSQLYCIFATHLIYLYMYKQQQHQQW